MRMELRDLMLQNLNKRPARIPPYQREFLFDGDAPYWYREFSQEDEDVFKDIVTEVLNNLEAQCMITAHTPIAITGKDLMSKFSKRIWIIDTNISDAYPGGALSALIIEDYGKIKRPWMKPKNNKRPIQEILWIVSMSQFPSYCLNSKAIEKLRQPCMGDNQ